MLRAMRIGAVAALGLALSGEFLARDLTATQPAHARPDEAAAEAGRHHPGARSPRNASYAIDVRLDPATRTLKGQEVLTWRNISRATATELQFHLYYNAWRNTASTWLREQQLAGGDVPDRREADWGWIDVTAVRLPAGNGPPVDLTSRKRFIAPDDGNRDDRTVLAVPLPQPVAPGQTITVQIEWTSRVPRTFARTGAVGDYFFLAQWFPKIGVLEDTGWNCHQFHAGTEFFADYGVYDVRITVPSGWVVGATGKLVERREGGDGTATHHHRQEDVHDFAWTASPHYLERRARFEHPRLPPVDIRLLLQPEHADQAERHFEATRAALRYYGEWYGAYPYGHVTVVDPAWQSGAGGMEYPTLFTSGTRWLAPRDVTQPEGVTIHEAGHQFWYGLVANNEFEHAWLDEGLNTFSTARAIERAIGAKYHSERFFGGFVPWVHRDLPVSRATDGNRLSGYRGAAESDVPATPSFRYFPGTGGAITYNKTALWLHTLERHLGWPALQRIMSTFFQRWQFRHPKPEDFFAVANEVSRQDLTWFFDQVYRSSNVFDYGVQDLRSAEVLPPIGYVDPLPSAPAGRTTRLEGRIAMHRTEVVVRRYGEATFPVDVVTVFENGERARERWDGQDRWKLYVYERRSPAVSAQVDPQRVLLLDVNYTNNSRTLKPRARPAATKWMLKWLMWVQDLMLTHALFI